MGNYRKLSEDIWACGECGAHHQKDRYNEAIDKARDCCRNEDAGSSGEIWRCPSCSESHDDPDSAMRCCFNQDSVFCCTNCGEEYTSDEYAESCCGSVEEPVEMTLECARCEAAHDNWAEARNCCTNNDDPGVLVDEDGDEIEDPYRKRDEEFSRLLAEQARVRATKTLSDEIANQVEAIDVDKWMKELLP